MHAEVARALLLLLRMRQAHYEHAASCAWSDASVILAWRHSGHVGPVWQMGRASTALVRQHSALKRRSACRPTVDKAAALDATTRLCTWLRGRQADLFLPL